MRFILASWLVLFHLPFCSFCAGQFASSTKATFTRADTLRGMLRPERTCYDVTFYRLEVKVDPSIKFIQGAVDIHFTAQTDFSRLQLDLFDNMEILNISYQGRSLPFQREFNAVFITFPQVKAGQNGVLTVQYAGNPVEAANPPWEGGFVWAEDRLGRPWVGVACQGIGASLWWPNKDHLSDEPDSMEIELTVPDSLMGVSNGQLVQVEEEAGWATYRWKVSYPINNYAVTVNVARYAHLKDEYESENHDEALPLDYYVLFYNRRRALGHFEQVKSILACYEQYLGKYPFWEDGFALVETPYLGMEHQSAIAYGNKYMRGYLGGMIPPGMNWDYVLVHETGHEYFGNAVSIKDLSEIWIHESLTTYLESLYVECMYGEAAAYSYLLGQRSYLENEEAILGPPDVNWENWDAPDHYYKGALMLHSLRQDIGQDSLWFGLLRTFYEKFRYKSVTTTDWINWVNDTTGQDYGPFFEQYLQFPDLPELDYSLLEKPDGLVFKARFKADVPNFHHRVTVAVGDELSRLKIGTAWKEYFLDNGRLDNFQLRTDLGLYIVDP